MLTWVGAGVACWLLGNVAFVLAVVRCRDRARRATAAVRGRDGGAGGSPEPPVRDADAVNGPPALRLTPPVRGGR